MFTLGDLDVLDARTWGDIGLVREWIAEEQKGGYKPGKFTRKGSMFDEAAR